MKLKLQMIKHGPNAEGLYGKVWTTPRLGARSWRELINNWLMELGITTV